MMTVESVSAAMTEAATVGAIEVLLQPDFGLAWVRDEVLHDFTDEPITDELVERVNEMINARLREITLTLVAELPRDKGAFYESYMAR